MDEEENIGAALDAPEYMYGGAPVIEDPASFAVAPTGTQMDLGFLDEPYSEGWDESKKALWQQKWISGISPTPADAAKTAQSILADERKAAAEAQDPLRLTQMEAEQAKLEERQLKVADAQRVQNEYAARRKNALSTIDEILANKKEYEAIVGPWDGSVGAVVDSLGVNEGRQVKRAKMSRLLFGDILELTKFLRPTTEKDIELAQRNVPGRFQNWPVFEDYLNEKKSVLLANETALVNPASNLPIGAKAPSSQEPNVYQQSQQNPAGQLRQQLESSDTLNLPDGRVLKRVTKQDGSIGWQ
jgi:hypothetical protein